MVAGWVLGGEGLRYRRLWLRRTGVTSERNLIHMRKDFSAVFYKVASHWFIRFYGSRTTNGCVLKEFWYFSC
jgi:hypothetical protein